MSKLINLKIYNDQDEVIAEFETSKVRWGVLEDAIELSESTEKKTEKEQIKAMGNLIQSLFPSLTDELLRMADIKDITYCFKQITNIVKNIEGTEEKNV